MRGTRRLVAMDSRRRKRRGAESPASAGGPASPGLRVGLRVGLFGGSFDPPHDGHLHVAREALRRLRLDQVWWIVSPGNPLKARPGASLAARVDAARRLLGRRPRIRVSACEATFGTRYTVDTVARLQAGGTRHRFVWIMGADNFARLHHWKAWSRLLARVPVAVLPRPGEQLGAGLSLAARRFARYRLPPRSAAGLALRRPPCWCLLLAPQSPRSSTRLRRQQA